MLLCQGGNIQGIIGQEDGLKEGRVALAENGSLQVSDQATTTQPGVCLVALGTHRRCKTLLVWIAVDIDTCKFLNCIQQTYTFPRRGEIDLCSLVDNTRQAFHFLGNRTNHLFDELHNIVEEMICS